MDKLEWYESVQVEINKDLDAFYNKFYKIDKLEKIGPNSYRVNPCPVCGHRNCCTLKDNAVHCFSGKCDWKGTHITAWYSYAKDKLGLTMYEAINKLEEFAHIKFPVGTPEEMQAYEKHQKQQRMLRIAEDFYHEQLMICEEKFEYKGKYYTPLEYMTEVRKRKIETLKAFKIGFSKHYFDLSNQLLECGYTKEEIKEAKVWQPEGTFVFFYRHPSTKEIMRTNIKNPFQARYKNRGDNGKVTDGDIIVGYSTGSKFMYFSPGFSFSEDVILVEGEHDVMSVYEQGYTNVAGTGGQLERENQLFIINKVEQDKNIYTMYDNDGAGEKYTTLTNEYFADRPVLKINYNDNFNDPDEYFKDCSECEQVSALINKATPLETDKYKIRKVGNIWSIATRERKLEFIIKGDKNGSFKGSATYFMNGVMTDREEDIALFKCKAKIKPLNFFLYDYIEEYFNSDIDKKKVEELAEIYPMTAKKDEVIKRLASLIFEAGNAEEIVNKIKIILKRNTADHENVVDTILKEVNDIQNKHSTISLSNIPKMRIGQYFNVRNNDAYMYFTYVKIDGDVKRKLPFLLRNDGTLIRLDLLKRKDTQCLLLVDNKYELPFEINDAVLELNECSLTQEWVEKFKNNEIPEDDLDPGKLVGEIEAYLKKFYYTNDPNIYKVLALYIYSTYYYELFAQIPYLYLTGSKGSGKSILDECIKLLSFNAKMALDITEAALFRTLSVEGGVLILDEQENLNAKNSRTTDNSMAAILKGGYARSGFVYRVNTEKGTTERFSVYGPKVISNIQGMDDVIEDRCIIIQTYALKLTKDTKMEDPKHYTEERLDEIRDLTSRCAISALLNFKALSDIYNGSLFETGNARLSQILTPIQSVAKLADSKETREVQMSNPDVIEYTGKFEKSLMSYWSTTLKIWKDNTEKNTPEGIIKRVVTETAKELYGLVPSDELDFTRASDHKYTEAIRFNKEEGWFEINIVHFKCFIEERKPGETAYVRYLTKWIKTAFKMEQSDIKRRSVHIQNEDLLKEFKGNERPKVNFYRFYFKDFINMDDDFMNPSSKKESIKKDMPLF